MNIKIYKILDFKLLKGCLMKKIKKNVFSSLSIRMIGFGVGVGVFFPFFTVLFGVDREIAFSVLFFIACVFAGVLVGVINFYLTKLTVGKKLRILTEKMSHVGDRVLSFDFKDGENPCTEEACLIQEDSEDEFGVCADAFNTMVISLVGTLQLQNQHRMFIKHLTKNLDLASLSNFALKALISFSDASAGAVLVEKEGELIVSASYGIINPELLSQNPIMLETLKVGESVRIDFPENIKVDGVLTEYKPTQIAVEPIVFSGSTSCIVVLASQQRMEKDFLDQLDIFVHDLSLVLNNSLQHEQIQRLAALDPLTGIYNRRFGLGRLQEEFSRSQRSGVPLGVMMIDIDKFKIINDTFGHIAGDRFLKNIVSVVKPILRNGDIFVRYGGEEFLAILPGASKNDIAKIAERVRYAVGESRIVYGESEISATLSIGVDSSPESEIDDPMQLIANADNALYKAKDTGRNKTVVFENVNIA